MTTKSKTRTLRPSREEFLAKIKEHARSHSPLTWKIFSRATGYHARLLTELDLGRWNDAKAAAGVEQTPTGKPRKWSREEVIKRVKKMYVLAKRAIIEDDFQKKATFYPGFSIRVVYDRFDNLPRLLREAGVPRSNCRGIANEQLIEELAELGRLLKRTPLQDDLRDHGLCSPATYVERFGSWLSAVRTAGLVPVREPLPSKATLKTFLRELADELGRSPASTDLEGRHFRVWTFFTVFGGWNQALVEAGLEPTKHYGISLEDLQQELKRLAVCLDHTPSRDEMAQDGKYGPSVYESRFGSWNNAVLACDLEPNSEDVKTKLQLDEMLIDLDAASTNPLSIVDLIDAGISHKAVVRIYGSWGNARKELGLKIGRQFSLSIDELLDDLRRVAAGSTTTGFSMTEYLSKGGRYSPSTFCRACEGWNPALKLAGLTPQRVLGISSEELIRALKELAKQVGRTPLRDDINNHGQYPASLYYLRFTTLRAAAEAADLPPNLQYAHPTVGEDGTLYDSSAEAQVANRLLAMQGEAEIALYTSHVSIGEEEGRRWTTDWEVELSDGRRLLIEYDGMGHHRDTPYWDPANEKLTYMKQRGHLLIVVSSSKNDPIHGTRTTAAKLRGVILSLSAH